jgi:hypothetical protein
LKLFLWGDSGAGKTTLALHFPGCVVIDLEGGTELYGGAFTFDVLKATTADEVMAAVDWLLQHPHGYRTLVIDPITVYWDALQAKWGRIFLQRNKGGKGHHGEFYELQPRDWTTLKAEFKELVRKLIALDMNVIVTARQKAQYAGSGFMRVIGETFDGEKSLPYLFDTILHLTRDPDGRFMATNMKDRSNRLPSGKFELTYALLEQCLGADALDRAPTPVAMVTAQQLDGLRHFIAASGMYPEAVAERLRAYGADSLESLTEANAQLIIEKFEAAGFATAQLSTTTQEEDHAAR